MACTFLILQPGSPFTERACTFARAVLSFPAGPNLQVQVRVNSRSLIRFYALELVASPRLGYYRVVIGVYL